MSKSDGNSTLRFIAGALVGAAVGAVAGILLAPRSGAETRSMMNEVATDAWGNVVDAYSQGASGVGERVDDFVPTIDVRTDELREKVDQARARMDQIRSSLSENVSQMASSARTAVNEAVGSVVEAAASLDNAMGQASTSVAASDVCVADVNQPTDSETSA